MRRTSRVAERRNVHLHYLTPCKRVLLDKLIVVRLVRKLPAFYGT
jgi:hypothetical protein